MFLEKICKILIFVLAVYFFVNDIAIETPIEPKGKLVMKTYFNQTGRLGVVVTGLVLVLLLLPLSTILASTNSGTRPVVIKLAVGITDQEVQHALDSLPDAGGEVLLPPGTIQIRQPIILRRDAQTLRGAGKSTLLRLTDGANCPAIILGEPVNHPQRVVRHLRVSDLAIDGNRLQQQRELWQLTGEGSEIRNNGITVQSVSDSTVENVSCGNCRSGGLVTTLGVSRLLVRGLTAFGNQFDGLACYLTTDSVFENLSLHDNPGAGISLDLAFNHNVISNAVLCANDLGIFMRASRANQFHNITISNSHHFGVFMAHAELYTTGGVRPAPASECTQNAFTNLSGVNCGSAIFRVNNTSCTNNVIISPQFAVNAKGGLSEARPDLVSVQ